MINTNKEKLEQWNENAIEERANFLAAKAIEIWRW